MTAEREMTLHEWVGKLPEIHLARKEFVAMQERLATLEAQELGFVASLSCMEAEAERLRKCIAEMEALLREAYGYTTAADSLLPERIRTALGQAIGVLI